MMIPRTSPFLLTIYAAALANPVVGFGQRFESTKGGFGVNRAVSTSLKAKDGEDDTADDDHLAGFRQRLERSFDVFDGDNNDPLAAFLRDDDESADDDDDQKRTTIVSSLDRIFNVDAAAAAMDEDDEEDYGDFMCEGDMCDLGDECKIPDAFKIEPGASELVMAFLNIQRAEPLRSRKEAGEWQ